MKLLPLEAVDQGLGSGRIHFEYAGGGAVTNARIVFKIDPSGNESLLHTFNGTDGLHPNGNLI